MSRASRSERRHFDRLFDEVRAATKLDQLVRIADRTDRRLTSWVLRESMKAELAERARFLGVPCKADPQDCFDYLLRLAYPQLGLFKKENPTRGLSVYTE